MNWLQTPLPEPRFGSCFCGCRAGVGVPAMLTVTQGTLPAGKSISGGGADEGKPGDGDRVPSGDKKRGIVRALGGVEGGRNAACNQSRDRPCKSWSRRRAVV